MKKGLYSRRFAWNKLIFYKNYFHQHLSDTYPGPLQTSKIEKFAKIMRGGSRTAATSKMLQQS